ncbi:MAG: hypothetical protein ABFS46_08410 [Myxococcota bacterium]
MQLVSPAHQNLPAPRRRRLHRLWVVSALLGILGVAVGLPVLLWTSRPLLEFDSPQRDQVIGAEGVEVVVRFPSLARVAPETFRALLNGADVTSDFTTGENGAYGRLFSMLDGENVLRVEVFGWMPWPEGLMLEQGREVRVLHRRRLDVDRG